MGKLFQGEAENLPSKTIRKTSPLSSDTRVLLKPPPEPPTIDKILAKCKDVPGFPNLGAIILRKWCVNFGFCYRCQNVIRTGVPEMIVYQLYVVA